MARKSTSDKFSTYKLAKVTNNSKSDLPPAGLNSMPGMNATFPEGSWSLFTFLDSVSSKCASNPATWNCYPYQPYSQDPNQNPTVFSWVIAATSLGSGSETSYMISSTKNPFAFNFNNLSMVLIDANRTTERYAFSIPITKPVIPLVAITADGTQANCVFSNTVLQAKLYTKMSKTFPNSTTTATSASSVVTTVDVFKAWPYAVEISESIGGGPNVPSCYEMINGNQGSPITTGIYPQPSNESCSCTYRNFNSLVK